MRAQREVDALIQELGGYWGPFEMLAALVEEIGELADSLLAVEGIKGTQGKDRLEEEIGDVLFALACIANRYGIDLEKSLLGSVRKYRARDSPRGKL